MATSSSSCCCSRPPAGAVHAPARWQQCLQAYCAWPTGLKARVWHSGSYLCMGLIGVAACKWGGDQRSVGGQRHCYVLVHPQLISRNNTFVALVMEMHAVAD
jgi:hypothetical protein